MRISKKAARLAVIYTVALTAVLSGFIAVSASRAASCKRQLEHTYQRAFMQLASEMDDIDSTLQKCVYCTTPSMISSVCAQVFGKAMSAQTALSGLPVSPGDLEETAGFIAKVQDYAYFLARSAACGTGPDEEQRSAILSLSQTASILAGNLTQLAADIQSGRITLHELERAQELADASDDSAGASQGFQQIESEFPEVPSLIYDGPFSAHISRMTPRFLAEKKEITASEAVDAAAGFTGLDPSVFTAAGERGGTIPVYLITARVDGGELSVEVTKAGGAILTMLNSRTVERAELSMEEAAARAAEYLKEHGFEDMRESYWMTEDNRVTVNFAYAQDGVICYPDLIKVTIAQDTGSVVGFESKGYLMSHTQREIPETQINEEDASGLVSPELEVLSHSLAVIPTSGKNEVFCHEFKCASADGRHYIVYVNAVTGAEEKLLILLESENGILTI